MRPRLAEAAAANVSELERVLVETATGANRQVWATIGCKHCGREGRYEIEVPDNRVRLDAVEKLLQQGLGRAREAEESRVPRLPESAAAVERMSWSDQQRLADVLCAEQIAAVATTAGRRSYVNESPRSVRAGVGYFTTRSTPRPDIER